MAAALLGQLWGQFLLLLLEIVELQFRQWGRALKNRARRVFLRAPLP
jgi:hypothetical protein